MIEKKQICVLIPIYKEALTDLEIKSVNQCIKILHSYSIIFVFPSGLNLDFYKSNFPVLEEYISFDKKYFNNIKGYNELMLSPIFYKAFEVFQYMLVYQTDSFVFKDDLLAWVQKKYDYIGGIWFDDFHGNPEEGARLWYPGNGGLSLRKIKAMLNLLSSKKPLKKWTQIIAEKKGTNNEVLFKNWKGFVIFCLNLFGYKNNSAYCAKEWDENEDAFFFKMSSDYDKLKVPEVNEALLFSWDRRPDYLFKKCKQLPFGCHAWFRNDFPYNENKVFWSSFIKT